MKKNSKLSGLYLGILFFLMYLPIGVVVVFSFNEARLPVRFTCLLYTSPSPRDCS